MSSKDMPELLKKAKELGYTIFTKGGYNLNIIGVRSKIQKPNKFCDMIHIIWRSEGLWRHEKYPVTTIPGAYWLLNPGRVEGTAIVKHDQQYRSVWEIGRHRGKYPALVQTGNEITIWRDNTKDIEADYGGKEYTGFYGINCHRSSSTRDLSEGNVDRWSAGCIVFGNPAHFNRFMSLCNMQVAAGSGSKFSFTLIHEDSLNRKPSEGKPAPKKPTKKKTATKKAATKTKGS